MQDTDWEEMTEEEEAFFKGCFALYCMMLGCYYVSLSGS
jgi:hypothetical protein